MLNAHQLVCSIALAHRYSEAFSHFYVWIHDVGWNWRYRSSAETTPTDINTVMTIDLGFFNRAPSNAELSPFIQNGKLRQLPKFNLIAFMRARPTKLLERHNDGSLPPTDIVRKFDRSNRWSTLYLLSPLEKGRGPSP